MTAYLELPFFQQVGGEIRYLGQEPIAHLGDLDAESAIVQSYKRTLGAHIPIRQPREPSADGSTILVIEPHPDDFALSASGFVLNELERGASCSVLNLFSRTAIGKFPWNDRVNISEEELEELRLKESRVAIETYLGQDFASLRLPLASLRGHTEIFDEHHEDPDLAAEIGRMILRHVDKTGANIIMFPMAIQGHKDHLVAHDATKFVRESLGDGCEFIMYEDYPYARNKLAYSRRLRHVRKELDIEAQYVSVDGLTDDMADLAIVYRSQFDDIDRDQMLAIMREDFRATSAEAISEGVTIEAEYTQRYWRVHED